MTPTELHAAIWGNMTADTYEDVCDPDYVFDNGPYFGPIPERPAKDAE